MTDWVKKIAFHMSCFSNIYLKSFTVTSSTFLFLVVDFTGSFMSPFCFLLLFNLDLTNSYVILSLLAFSFLAFY